MSIYKIDEIRNKIICGDTLRELQKFPNESIDTIITSPPYWGLRDYQIEEQIGLEKTLNEYIDKLLQITMELKRVLKPTGVMFWNHGDSYGGSGNGSWNAPIEIRGKQYRKNISIDTEYLGSPRKDKKMKAKCLCLQNYRLILKMIDEQQWILRNDIKWIKPNHMPSSVKDRFANSHESIFMLVKNNNPIYYYNIQTGLMSDRKPKELKEGIDWEYKRDDEEKIVIDKKTGESKKRSYWHSVVYWFDLDNVRVPHAESSMKRAEYPIQKFGTGQQGANFAKNTKNCETVILNPKTKIPENQAESFGSPRARNYRTGRGSNNPELNNRNFMPYHPKGEPSVSGMRRPPQPNQENAFNAQGKNPGDVWNLEQNRGDALKILKERGCQPTGIGPIGFDHNLLNNPKGKNPGDVFVIATQPLSEAHFACFPEKLLTKPILSSCPQQICKKCGKAKVRIIKRDVENQQSGAVDQKRLKGGVLKSGGKPTTSRPITSIYKQALSTTRETIGWTNCSCSDNGDKWRPGIVLDPFMGSATTAIVARKLERDFIGIEINPAYCEMARDRIIKETGELFGRIEIVKEGEKL